MFVRIEISLNQQCIYHTNPRQKKNIRQNPDGSSSPVDSYQMTNSQFWSYPISECVQGLVLFNGLVIWNPAMGRFLNLPKPKTGNGGMSFLGYDPLEGKHKVVHLDYTTHARVLTLGAQESWRTITKGSPSQSWRPAEAGGGGRCFNGILYFSARFGAHRQQIIMSFDVGSEKFNSIKIPEGYRDFPFQHMIPYEGRLALASPDDHISRNKFNLRILKDADGREWTHKRLLVPSHRDKTVMSTRLYFNGVTDAGELMFAPLWFEESFYILYLNPRRNSIREALFEGIVGDGFRRRYGLGKHDIRQFHIFPNHMESLVPSL